MPTNDQFTFSDWLFPSSSGWGFLVTVFIFLPFLAAGAAFLCYLFAAARLGPVEGFYGVARVVRDGFVELSHISPRRTWAIARLAIQESIRRRVLLVFAVFVLILLLAGWFLDTDTDHPAPLYLSFVLTSTSYLVLMLALVLSAFSLPNDIKTRTIYTVITKPVRAIEIVIGRIIGFSLIGTVMLVLMCLVSYGFVVRGLKHEHQLEADSLVSNEDGLSGRTTFSSHHRHEFKTVETDGVAITESVRGHTHTIRLADEGGDGKDEVGPARGMLIARVPVYGSLRFLDRRGNETDRGVNVGNEYQYWSYIEGGTLHTAIWEFDGIWPDRFPDGLPMELDLRVFRTYKANIERRVMGEIWVASADPSRPMESDRIIFESHEFTTQPIRIPRQLKRVEADGSFTDIDLFEDLAPDGRLEVRLQCADPGQYLGVAQRAAYIRAKDASFLLNFVKGYGSIWLQMVVVTGLGVMFSTFLSGPVAMVATIGAVFLGFLSQFVAGVQTGEVMGGGPLESVIRLLTQENIMVELDIGIAAKLVQAADWVMMLLIRGATTLMPDFASYSTANDVAKGFNISGGLLASHTLLALTYTLVVAVIGYFCLKTREIAA